LFATPAIFSPILFQFLNPLKHLLLPSNYLNLNLLSSISIVHLPPLLKLFHSLSSSPTFRHLSHMLLHLMDFLLLVILIYMLMTQRILDSCNLTQLVNFPTHRYGHTLDLIITTTNLAMSPAMFHHQNSPSDHFPIFCELIIQPPSPPLKHISFRCIDAIQIPHFVRDIFHISSKILLFQILLTAATASLSIVY
jgi:hypothetical protein